ncbi:Pph3p [Histomonas meleagridis]|uniref:Pph3p n=1 Tax=Histomonas meleagridis TaxID=135588 RepID=UPI0035594351|nr:Pph3p [Histomonas meleagridis]KAH0798198.1 Pph3p [Histomonas meleagridis]
MDVDKIITQLSTGNSISSDDVIQLIDTVTPLFLIEPNVLRLDPPITLAGDTHGQLEDALKLFEVSGKVGDVRYLFLGDYVDRGLYSIELLCLLIAYKIKYPDRIYLLRGNHETQEVNSEYGFFDEINTKYGTEEIYNKCNDMFETLPLAAIVDNRLFCVHGGLSPDLNTIQQIEDYQRVQQPELTSFVGNMLWSDPDEVEDYERSERRSGYLFGEAHVEKFLKTNNLQKIVRSHEMVDGYEEKFNGKLVTIWSAPNYCYICGNKASCLKVKGPGEDDEYIVYEAMPFEKRFTPQFMHSMYFK